MESENIKTALHKIIDEVTDDKLLKILYQILSAKTGAFTNATVGLSLTQDEIDRLLEESEEDIRSGNVTLHSDLKNEI